MTLNTPALTFTLTLTLKDDLRTFGDVSHVLAKASETLRNNGTRFIAGDTMPVWDSEGRWVGSWKVSQ